MYSSQSDHILVQRWKAGDESAATVLFNRHIARLCFLAERLLDERLKRRVSAEEIAQSALGSFFRRGKEHGVYSIVDSSELAKLLATITLNKIRKHAEHHKAQKRDFRLENEFDEELAQSLVVEPANEQVQALLEVLEIVLQGYDKRDVEIVGLAREGFSAEEIASRTNCTQSTVRRVLARIFSQLQKLLSENSEE